MHDIHRWAGHNLWFIAYHEATYCQKAGYAMNEENSQESFLYNHG